MHASSIPVYLQSIRKATRDAHEELESIVGTQSLGKEHFDLNNYTSLLTCHFHMHHEVARHFNALESQVSSFPLDWPDCKRIHFLEEDLQQLKALPASPLTRIPLRSLPFALGLCYVVEGSCMGNAQLWKMLRGNETFMRLGAYRFLAHCKEGLSERWKSFLPYMETYGADRYEELEEGAMKGFDGFKSLWLQVHTF